VYLYPGEQRSVHDMLIAIAVGSGNDAAYAMAEFVGGSYDAFIEMMNIRAAELAMSDTHFVNPHGLHDPNHYTTARDLSKLAFHALNVPHFLEYTSIYEYEFRPAPNLLTLWNTNRLLKWYAGTDGMKTGYTEEAGRNLVTTATRDGLRLISVVLGCEERRGHFSESMNLLNYGFNTFQYTSIYQQGQIIAQAAVAKGREDMVDLVASRDIGYISAKKDTAEISSRLEIPAWLSAPIKSGDIGGKLIVYKNGDLLCESELLAATAVDKSGLLRFWGKMLQIMGFN
ncbi:MAG: D-alanyl-D-alanine carboxypeptidase family protein, partial [Clostridiales bacterium]